MNRRTVLTASLAGVASLALPGISGAHPRKPKVLSTLLEVERRQGFQYSRFVDLDGTLVVAVRGQSWQAGATLHIELFDPTISAWRQIAQTGDSQYTLTGQGRFRFGLNRPRYARLGLVEVG